MNDSPDLCMVLNLPDRTMLCRAPSRRIANAIQRSMLDTAVVQASGQTLRNDLAAMIESGFWVKAGGRPLTVEKLDARPESAVLEKYKRAILLRDAFVTLDWFEQHIRNVYDGTTSLNSEDLPAYLADTGAYAKQLALSLDIDEEQAAKQLEFDYQAVSSLILRARSVWWRFQRLAYKINTQQNLDDWTVLLRDEVFGIGMV